MVRCETCVFWAPQPEIGPRVGRCQRFPPQALLDEQTGKAKSRWSFTGHKDWCGEHATRDAQPDPAEPSEHREAT